MGVIAFVVVLALVSVLVFVLWKDWDSRRIGEGELGACSVVVLGPDDSRSLAHLQVGESHALAHHTVVCTPEAQHVRVVSETASGAIHVFDWPTPAGLECTSSSACLQLELGCSGEFRCTTRGEFRCTAGSCSEGLTTSTSRP
jgi:hypothetical protein